MIRCYFPLISDGSVSKHRACQENKVWTEEENNRGASFFLSPASSDRPPQPRLLAGSPRGPSRRLLDQGHSGRNSVPFVTFASLISR